MNILLDASAIMAIILNEPNKENKINETKKISPLENIKGIKTNITMKEILDAIKHGRQ